jgi:hypothetical protein
MIRASMVVLMLGATLARADAQFIAQVNPTGMLVRGPTAELPGPVGYSPSLQLGFEHGRLRWGVVGILHLGAPSSAVAGSVGLRVTFDAFRLSIPPALSAAVFGGAQAVTRFAGGGVYVVPTGQLGLRLGGLEFSVGVGGELATASGRTGTWNLEAFSLAVNIPEFVKALMAICTSRFHGEPKNL